MKEFQINLDTIVIHNSNTDLLFHNNVAQLALVAIQNVSYVEISRCEFYQNEGQTYLILISVEEVHVVLLIFNVVIYYIDLGGDSNSNILIFEVIVTGYKPIHLPMPV